MNGVHPSPAVPHTVVKLCQIPPKAPEAAAVLRRPCREDMLRLTVPVAPKERRLVVGPKGEALQKLQQMYSAVRVIVPPPQD